MRISDELLISAYLQNGGNQTLTAQQLKTTKATICRRLNKPNIQDSLRRYRQEIVNASLNKIIALSVESSNELENLLHEKNPFVRLQAIKLITQLARDFITLNDLNHRLDLLEESQAHKV